MRQYPAICWTYWASLHPGDAVDRKLSFFCEPATRKVSARYGTKSPPHPPTREGGDDPVPGNPAQDQQTATTRYTESARGNSTLGNRRGGSADFPRRMDVNYADASYSVLPFHNRKGGLFSAHVEFLSAQPLSYTKIRSASEMSELA